MVKKILIIFIFLFAAGSFTCADSIWTSESSSPYSTSKTFNVGDIITVMILESSSALSSAGTDTGVKDDLGLRFTHTLAGLDSSIGPRSEVGFKGDNKYRGTGKTSRVSNIQAKVAAIVTKVFSNGNLAVLGRHAVEVNGERQEIKITGVIRSMDVTIENTIFSYQVADANISVKGEGAVAEAETPGWFTRIVNWLF